MSNKYKSASPSFSSWPAAVATKEERIKDMLEQTPPMMLERNLGIVAVVVVGVGTEIETEVSTAGVGRMTSEFELKVAPARGSAGAKGAGVTPGSEGTPRAGGFGVGPRAEMAVVDLAWGGAPSSSDLTRLPGGTSPEEPARPG